MRELIERLVYILVFIAAIGFVMFTWAAFIQGIESWLGWSDIVGAILFPILYIFMPGLGTLAAIIIAFYGAREGFGWGFWPSTIFFIPMVIFPALAIVAGGIDKLFRIIRGR